MANLISVAGKSGSGKSTAIRTLDPKTTFIIAVTKKDLPFKGAGRKYTKFETKTLTGNHITLSKANDIIKVMKIIHAKRPEITTIVIDDIQYNMSKQAMARVSETGYGKHTEIAADYNNILEVAQLLRDDLDIFTMTHIDEERDSSGNIINAKIKTLGKVLDNWITIDGLYTWNLFSKKIIDMDDDGNEITYHVFQTNDLNDTTTCKTPAGAFDTLYIPNSLQLVKDKIAEYKMAEDDEDDEIMEIPTHLNKKMSSVGAVISEKEDVDEFTDKESESDDSDSKEAVDQLLTIDEDLEL